MKLFLIITCLLIHPCFLRAESDFDALMGRKTKHWQHVAQEKDVAFLSFAKEIYEKHKDVQFTAQGPYKIPPVIHFIWLGPKQFPPQSVENVRTWIAKNPGWKVKFWTDRDRMPPCAGMEVVNISQFSFLKLERQFYASENWGEKSDVLRYEILFQEGGVYADHDANCLQSFDGMHKGYDFYCGLEAPHEAFVGCNITCGNGVIGARPNHPTLAKVIDHIAERWDALKEKFRGQDAYSKIEIVMQRTYIALTHCLKSTMNQEGNTDIVFPAGYFFAKTGIPSVFSQHFYATSWDDFRHKKTEEERFLEKTINKVLHDSRSILRNILLVIAFNLLFIVLGIKLLRAKEKPP